MSGLGNNQTSPTKSVVKGTLTENLTVGEFYTGDSDEDLKSFLSRLAPSLVKLSDNDEIGSEFGGYISFNKETNQYGIYLSGGTGPAFTANEPVLASGFKLLKNSDTVHIHNPELKMPDNFKSILRSRLASQSNNVLEALSDAYLAGRSGKRNIISGMVDYSYNFVKKNGKDTITAGGNDFSDIDKQSTGYLVTRNANREILYQHKGNTPTVFTTY